MSIPFDEFTGLFEAHFKKMGFQFLNKDANVLIESIDPSSRNKTLDFLRGMNGVHASQLPDLTDSSLQSALRNILKICDLVGITYRSGGAELALVFDASTLSQEDVVGRCSRICDATAVLKTFSPNISRVRFHKRQMPTIVYAAIVYDNSDNAGYFRKVLEKKCRQLMGASSLFPFAVDLAESRALTPSLPLGDGMGLKKLNSAMLPDTVSR